MVKIYIIMSFDWLFSVNILLLMYLGKWKTECVLCLDYINILLSEEPLKNFSFSLVNRYENTRPWNP